MSKSCCECGRSHKNMVRSQGTTYCQACYTYFIKRGRERHTKPGYGEVTYDSDGRPICHICGMSQNKLMSHVRHYHEMTAYNYKKKFGLETSKSIMSNRAKQTAREKNLEHFDKVVKGNLIEKGKSTRYVKGCKGRTRDQVSEQTRRKLAQNLFPKKRGG